MSKHFEYRNEVAIIILGEHKYLQLFDNIILSLGEAGWHIAGNASISCCGDSDSYRICQTLTRLKGELKERDNDEVIRDYDEF